MHLFSTTPPVFRHDERLAVDHSALFNHGGGLFQKAFGGLTSFCESDVALRSTLTSYDETCYVICCGKRWAVSKDL